MKIISPPRILVGIGSACFIIFNVNTTHAIFINVIYMYVTFHGIQFPREYFIIDVSLAPLGHIRMWRVRLSWDSRVTCSRVSERALYRERRSLLSLRIVLQ